MQFKVSFRLVKPIVLTITCIKVSLGVVRSRHRIYKSLISCSRTFYLTGSHYCVHAIRIWHSWSFGRESYRYVRRRQNRGTVGLLWLHVVVQFYPWFKFCIPLFQTHYHTLPKTKKQRKMKFKPMIKLNHNNRVIYTRKNKTRLT